MDLYDCALDVLRVGKAKEYNQCIIPFGLNNKEEI